MFKSKLFRSITLAAAALVLASPAAAEPPTASRIDSAPGSVRAGDVEAEDAQERIIQAYTRCLVRSQRSAARRLLDLPYLSREQQRAALRISDPDCLGMSGLTLRLQYAHIVGRLAEAMFAESHASEDVSRFAGLSDEAADAIGLVPRNNAEDLAFCVLRADPQAVRALVASRWDSAEQAASIRRITPHLGPCVVAGETLDLNARSLRLLLATGLYRAVTLTAQPRS